MNLRILNNDDIQSLYNDHVVKDQSYFKRFETPSNTLPFDEHEKLKWMDPPRVASIIDFKDWIGKHELEEGNSLLSTCSGDPELRYLNYKTITLVEYPPHDLHTFEVEKKDHDFAVFNQTIEHLHTPILAINQIREHLKDGGYVYTTVPTINIPHLTPIHFNGYTPTGLCALFESCGFETVECGYWGNYKYIDYIFKNGNWCNYSQILDDSGRLTYDPVCQAQTWILAKKVD
jgi:SAM-dependent methyltransferase